MLMKMMSHPFIGGCLKYQGSMGGQKNELMGNSLITGPHI